MLGEGRDVRVVVDEDRETDALLHEVANGDVGDLEVDRLDRDTRGRGRSSPGCRARPRARPAAPASPPQLPRELLDQLVLAEPDRGLPALVVDVLLGVDDPDGHLGAAADRRRSSREAQALGRVRMGGPAGACASIDIPCLRREMIGRRAVRGLRGRREAQRSHRSPAGPGLTARPKAGKKPEYTVYGSEGRRRAWGKKRSPPSGEAAARGGEKPPYTRLPLAAQPARPLPQAQPRRASERRAAVAAGGVRGFFSRLTGGKRPWLRWILIFAVGWLLLSFITFAISAQIQKGKLPQSAKDALKGGPAVLAGQNILILGGDRRGKTQHNANGSEGQGPPRADTIMVLHASLTSFRKLSIPRDSYAAIPNCGEQKINASLACNTRARTATPPSTIKTVENFLGIDINHIVIVDFDGFAEFINTLGGVKIDIPDTNGKKDGPVVCGDVDGGKKQGGVSLKLPPGEVTLQGDKALAYAESGTTTAPRARTTATAPPASRRSSTRSRGA